jgi:transposase-like protein
MARGKAHSEETKAAVLAALLTGQGVNEVARQYELDSSVVSRWKKQLPAEQLQQVATEKRDEFGDLLAGYLRTNLVTLQVQSEFFRNEEWLKKQPASDLAVLHGVVTDKTIRLLEAAERAADVLQPEPGAAD